VKNHIVYAAHIARTPIEAQMGRLMRAPDHDGFTGAPEGFTPGGEENNTGGNSGQPNGESQEQNNSGDDFDPVAFWNEDDGETDGSPSNRSSAESDDSSSSTEGNDFATQLVSRIDSLNFDGVFTAEIASQLNEGNFDGANEAIQNNLRKAVKESMVTQVQMMRKFSEGMISQVKQMIGESMKTDKNENALLSSIPAARNPKTAPLVKNIYQQALRKSKGDTTKAINATKQMLATLTSETADELGFDVAPTDPHASRAPKKTNWLEELAGRG